MTASVLDIETKNRIGIMEHTENTGHGEGEGRAARLQPEDVAAVFTPEFLDQERCREWILNRLHGHGVSCPGCGASIEDKQRRVRFWSGKRLSCPACGKKFTALTGTVLSGSSLDFRGIFFLMQALGDGAKTTDTAKRIGCDPKTVTNWRNKLGRAL